MGEYFWCSLLHVAQRLFRGVGKFLWYIYEFARITLKVNLQFKLQQTIFVDIDGKSFALHICEDFSYQQHPSGNLTSQITKSTSSESLDSDETCLIESFREDNLTGGGGIR